MNFNAIDLEGIRSMLIELLLKENSSTAVNLWFGDLKLASIDENEAVFVSPTELKKKIIQQRFAISMADHLNEILGFEPSVVIHSSENIDTKLRKVGAFLGDGADIGCGSVLNPGTVIGRNTRVYPLTLLRGVYPESSIVKGTNEIIAINTSM